MIAATAWFLLGLLLLALGGDSIVKAASGLAQRFGASPFMAGLLLVAFGTSLPELWSTRVRSWWEPKSSRWATRWAATSSTSA